MKLIFMGTSDFAIPSLEKLARSDRHEILAVICTPDKAKGRGLKLEFSPVKKVAINMGLTVLQPEKLHSEEFISHLKKINPDAGIVVSFGRILKKSILELPKYGCINIHGSLLPKYRGSAPIQWAIINGEEKTGVTSMCMDEGVDTGDIILQQDMPINPEDTSETVFAKLADIGGDILLETLDKIEQGKFNHFPQDNDHASYTRMIKKEDGRIDWNMDSNQIINLVRGLTPWPGTFTYMGDKVLKIKKAEIYGSENIGLPGNVSEVIKQKGIVVSTKDGTLLVTEVQPENKKRMPAFDFAIGHNIKRGFRFEH